MSCDCADGPTPVTDWACGDVVCCACGVVVEGHIIDESPEWRRGGGGGDDGHRGGGGPSSAPERVGMPDSRGRPGGTFLVVHGTNKRLCRGMAAREEPAEAALYRGLEVLTELLGAMRLPSSGVIAGTARELFTDLHEERAVRCDTRRALAAAAVYYGCKLENAGRELRLVSDVCGVDARALNAATSEYKAALGSRAYYPRLFATLQAGKLIDVFLDRLRLPAEQRRRVWRTAHQLDEAVLDAMDCGRKPRTICSGILYVAARQEGVDAVGKKEITEACNVCQQTLDKVVAQIRAATAAPPPPGPGRRHV